MSTAAVSLRRKCIDADSFENAVSMTMFFINSLLIKSFITQSACKTIHASLFRFMILFRLNSFEHLAAMFTRKPFTLMSSHVHLKIVTIIVTFSTNVTEVRVFPCVVLNVSIESRFRIECFVTFIASPYFQFGP